MDREKRDRRVLLGKVGAGEKGRRPVRVHDVDAVDHLEPRDLEGAVAAGAVAGAGLEDARVAPLVVVDEKEAPGAAGGGGHAVQLGNVVAAGLATTTSSPASSARSVGAQCRASGVLTCTASSSTEESMRP